MRDLGALSQQAVAMYCSIATTSTTGREYRSTVNIQTSRYAAHILEELIEVTWW